MNASLFGGGQARYHSAPSPRAASVFIMAARSMTAQTNTFPALIVDDPDDHIEADRLKLEYIGS